MRLFLLIIFLAINTFAAAIPGIDGFTGNIGLYAAKLDVSANVFVPLEELRHNETNLFPLASAFKTFVLLEVMKKINSGELYWNQKVQISDKDRSLDTKQFRGKKPLKK